VIALYGELDELVDSTEQPDDPDDILIGCGDRAMPAVFLAVLEVLGISRDTFSATEAA
jgi:hypothetical protein